jgi:hypothetical protein
MSAWSSVWIKSSTNPANGSSSRAAPVICSKKVRRKGLVRGMSFCAFSRVNWPLPLAARALNKP